MSSLPPSFLVTFLTTMVFLAWLALSRRTRAGTAADFAVAGRQAGRWRVSGAIMGTLVGGASTIGTAQLAFLFGLSAWWFTLGAGLACLFLGLGLAGPLRSSEVETVPAFLETCYGSRARIAASLFTALGMFIHIVAQLLACAALLVSLFGLGRSGAALLAALLVALVALGGGMRSAGPVGLAKLALLYLTMVGSGCLAWRLAGGWAGLSGHFEPFPWFSLFGYGTARGLSDLLSMLVGVVSTQVYLQAIFAARDIREARAGALVSAVLIPPLGLMGITVGLAMRVAHPELDSVEALPFFLLTYLPGAWSGAAFAALLFASVATAAGLALGVGTTVQTDLLGGLARDSGNRLRHLRLVTLGAVAAALVLLMADLESMILRWSFLSMGLRGAAVCLPLLGIVFLPRHISRRCGALAVILGPLAAIAAGLCGWPPWPPLFTGLLAAAAAMGGGILIERKRLNR